MAWLTIPKELEESILLKKYGVRDEEIIKRRWDYWHTRLSNLVDLREEILEWSEQSMEFPFALSDLEAILTAHLSYEYDDIIRYALYFKTLRDMTHFKLRWF